ncbi:dTDP-4-amino-4,6-dideoxygalactose transaminase [Geoalkalibacter ferrihydriticus]|uniref:Erythromycin biosynthesis sensory transduction protein eryC1 n=2 Tax=Geoalkalibacter ferrihydriticus TaxID=392333 RepID=A0A0C2DQQ5_9BACT|nr:DegT/DnrJ/EryC1/StrS family aminotransferase [Geoalkalibacter ferrihydriticus]KIH75759.1 erythromycin biosynthesis sensory transduction protein eryC1 [Geoalkalibacter ferrihydriticus DSM 17813]SDM63752.1 dTDP-4-amino-4,6-dideoxygalactose transaminase [Geoalkalibacter ferrihydriticus]
MNIPMVDLKQQYLALKQDIDEALQGVLDSTHFILGPNVQAFEQEAASYLGVKHAVGCASGTDALHLALRAAGIGEGDEVITPAFTFIATAEAISYVGAKPVFVDIDARTFNLDPARVEEAITPQTRAILPVHLFGQPADLVALRDLCKTHKLLLIEDCAQSFGAGYAEQMTGSFGNAGCFSFFPSKNLGCFGDGGLITTNDDDLARELLVLRNHGSRQRYHHSIIGYNSRLDEMQAAILRIKLKHIDEYNRLRRRNAHLYNEALKGLGLTTPHEDGKGVHVFHQYTLLLDGRDRVQKALSEAGIASAVYYPIPLHRQEVYRDLMTGVSLPVTEKAAEQVLSLPMYPELTSDQISNICQVISGAL